jgi:hypothetical protein
MGRATMRGNTVTQGIETYLHAYLDGGGISAVRIGPLEFLHGAVQRHLLSGAAWIGTTYCRR